jgi:uncharacterized protein YndB with AHSA1/START domain
MNATAEILTVSRLLKVPRARVFAAWTTPEIAQWICTGERRVIFARVDARVGGEYHIKINTPDHGDVEFRGTYRTVEPPARVVFTWIIGDCIPELIGHESQVTVDMAEQRDGTLVTITHEGLPTAESRAQHGEGWQLSLENLERFHREG